MDVSLWAKEMYYATCIQNMTSYSKCNINTHKTTRLDLFILNANNHNYFLYYLHSLSILFPMRSFISVVHQIYNIHTCFSFKKNTNKFSIYQIKSNSHFGTQKEMTTTWQLLWREENFKLQWLVKVDGRYVLSNWLGWLIASRWLVEINKS